MSRHPARHACMYSYEYTRFCKGWVRRQTSAIVASCCPTGWRLWREPWQKGSLLSVRTTVALDGRTRFVPPALHVAEQQIYRVWPSLAVVGDKGLAGALAALVCTPQNDSASLLCAARRAMHQRRRQQRVIRDSGDGWGGQPGSQAAA